MILITGATGFVGKETLVQLKEKGYAVRALVRDPDRIAHHPDFQGVGIFEGNILDVLSLEAAMKGVEKVIHCAATVSFQKSDEALLMKTNVEGTANVVNVALDAGVRKLVHVSSIAALGRSQENEPILETTKWKNEGNNSRYAISKYKAEREVYRGLAEGLPTVLALPGVILGPGDWNSGSAALIKLGARGLPFYPAGSNGFVGVRDVARALINLTESPLESGEKFILVSQNVTYQLLLSLIAQETGKKPPIWPLGPGITRLAGMLSEALAFITRSRPVLTRETARTASHRYIYDGSLYSSTFQTEYESVEEILKVTCQRFLAEYGNHT